MWIWLLLHYALASVFSVPEGISWTSRRRRAPASPARAQTHHFFFSNSECSGRPWLTVLFFWNAGRTAHRWVFDLRRKRALSIVGNLLVVAKEKSFLSGGSWTTAAGPETGRKKKKSVLTIFIFFLFKFPSLFFFRLLGEEFLYILCARDFYLFFSNKKKGTVTRGRIIYILGLVDSLFKIVECVRPVFTCFFFCFLTHHRTLPYYSPLFFLHQAGGGETLLCVGVCVYLCAGVCCWEAPTHHFNFFFLNTIFILGKILKEEERKRRPSRLCSRSPALTEFVCTQIWASVSRAVVVVAGSHRHHHLVGRPLGVWIVVGFHQSLTKKKKSTRKEEEEKGRQRRRPSIRNNNNNNYLATRRVAKGFGWHYYFE